MGAWRGNGEKAPLPTRARPVAGGAAVLVALALDCMGEPPARLHPVVGYGKLIGWLARHAPRTPGAQLAYGGGLLLVALPVAVLPARVMERAARQAGTRWGGWADALLVGAALKPFFARAMLVEAGRAVRVALERDDLPAAREALGSLVSRDRATLPASLAAAAAIESLAENLSDSVVAPLFWHAVFGLPGAAVYRFVNTADAMIGYRGEPYEYLGKAAARLDDALNLIPARLTAVLIIALAPLYGEDARRAWQIWRRDADATTSPNAGQPMAAAAGATGVRLEKVGQYTLGGDLRLPTARDLAQAETMAQRVGLAAATGLAVARTLIAARKGVAR